MITKLMHYVADEVQSSDSATWRSELPNRGALHAILLKAQVTNGATSGRAVTVFDAVSEIEVIADGTEVLFSLKPLELEKWYETLNGKAMQTVEDEGAGAVQEMVFPIMFGRELYDPEYWLPLARFKDVKVEVTYSFTATADGGFATGTMTFDLELLITHEDGQLPYAGTLTTRRINSYTPVASGDQEIELPGNSIVRAIGNYVYEAGVADGSNVTKIILEDKSDGQKLFEADWDDFIHFNRELFGAEIVHNAELLLTNNEIWTSRIGEILGFTISLVETVDTTGDEVDMVNVDGIAGDKLTLDLYNCDITAGAESFTASATDRQIFAMATGKSPSYFGLIPFVYNDSPAGWLDTSKYGVLKVVHTNGNAGGAAYVSIQEFRKF